MQLTLPSHLTCDVIKALNAFHEFPGQNANTASDLKTLIQPTKIPLLASGVPQNSLKRTRAEISCMT